MPTPLVAVFDVGKTHTKLMLVDAASGRIAWTRETRSAQFHAAPSHTSTDARPDSVCRQLEVARLEQWLIGALAAAPDKEQVRVIVPVTHGASAVWLDAEGKLLCAPDYEDNIYERDADHYAAARDEYAQTFSPLLPQGLNLGRQIFFLQHFEPALYARCAHLLLYPQYWAWRLAGVMASEVTSLGCHTDLWHPVTAGFSLLAQRQGWTHLLPPIRGAAEQLGRLTHAMQRATGLSEDCRVVCGIHDSNASYLSHLASWRSFEPFAVISSGTWLVIFSQGTALTRLREDADMLANVDAGARPVATARFMGGREYEAIAGPAGTASLTGTAAASAVAQAAEAVIARGALPADAPSLAPTERLGLASLHVALRCDQRLDDLDSHQPVVLDGPVALDPLVPGLLAALRPHAPVYIADVRSGLVRGALRLAQPGLTFDPPTVAVTPLLLAGLEGYRERWRTAGNVTRSPVPV